MKKIVVLAVLFLAVIGAVFVSASTSQGTIRIEKGWNLIQGFNLGSLEGQAFDSSHIKAIYGFDSVRQEYVRGYPNPEDAKLDNSMPNGGDLEDYLEESAVWVYSDEASTTNYRLQEPLPLNERQLYSGWNFVGISKDMIPSPFDANLKDIKGNCNIEKSYFWIASMQRWEDAPVEYAQLEENSIGSGWLVKVSNDCKLGSTAGDVSPPPALP